MEQAADTCFKAIIAQTKRPLFVGVVGDSGSGKSYLTGLLVNLFEKNSMSYALINHDEFLISRQDREPMKSTYYMEGKYKDKSHWEVLENMFRLDEYQRVIQELKSGNETLFKPYSREKGVVSDKERIVVPTDFIIFDTSMLVGDMDYIILVDVSQENIIKRKLARDADIRTPEQIIEMHEKVQGYYWLDRGRPTNPNIIIDNNDITHVGVITNLR